MLRDIVTIDESKCDGCGLCVPACHEGALQIIDGKARLVSDLLCDGLGACLGECPKGALKVEKKEAEPYDERKVMELIVEKGFNTVVAHLKHLKEHEEYAYLKEAAKFLRDAEGLPFDIENVWDELSKTPHHQSCGGGCPGSAAKYFAPKPVETNKSGSSPSQLSHWPVQLSLVNPTASHFRNSDLLVAADCTAFAMGGFHSEILHGKSLAIACPKLDQNLEAYVEKLKTMIDEAQINTLTVMVMEVPCCVGLVKICEAALQRAKRKVPLKVIALSVQGEIIKEIKL